MFWTRVTSLKTYIHIRYTIEDNFVPRVLSYPPYAARELERLDGKEKEPGNEVASRTIYLFQ